MLDKKTEKEIENNVRKLLVKRDIIKEKKGKYT